MCITCYECYNKSDNLDIIGSRFFPAERIGKSGVNPVRSRRCNGRVVFNKATVKMGRQNTALTPKPEDLPKIWIFIWEG